MTSYLQVIEATRGLYWLTLCTNFVGSENVRQGPDESLRSPLETERQAFKSFSVERDPASKVRHYNEMRLPFTLLILSICAFVFTDGCSSLVQYNGPRWQSSSEQVRSACGAPENDGREHALIQLPNLGITVTGDRKVSGFISGPPLIPFLAWDTVSKPGRQFDVHIESKDVVIDLNPSDWKLQNSEGKIFDQVAPSQKKIHLTPHQFSDFTIEFPVREESGSKWILIAGGVKTGRVSTSLLEIPFQIDTSSKYAPFTMNPDLPPALVCK